MDMIQQVTAFCEHFDEVVIEIPWVARRKADTRNIDLTKVVHQITESIVDVIEIFSVRIDILAKEHDFFISMCGKLPYFLDDVLRPSATLFSACIGNDA